MTLFHRFALASVLSLLIAAPALAPPRTRKPPGSNPKKSSPVVNVPPDQPEAGTPYSTEPPPERVLVQGGSIPFYVTGNEKTTYNKPVADLWNAFHIQDLVIEGCVLVSNGVVTGVDPMVAAGDLESLDPTLWTTDPATASAITSFAYRVPVFHAVIDVATGTYFGDSTLTVSPVTAWPIAPPPYPAHVQVDLCKVRPATFPAGGAVGDLDMAAVHDCGLVSAQELPGTAQGMHPLRMTFVFNALPGRVFGIQKKL
jgi:hypothetical protein